MLLAGDVILRYSFTIPLWRSWNYIDYFTNQGWPGNRISGLGSRFVGWWNV